MSEAVVFALSKIQPGGWVPVELVGKAGVLWGGLWSTRRVVHQPCPQEAAGLLCSAQLSEGDVHKSTGRRTSAHQAGEGVVWVREGRSIMPSSTNRRSAAARATRTKHESLTTPVRCSKCGFWMYVPSSLPAFAAFKGWPQLRHSHPHLLPLRSGPSADSGLVDLQCR